VGEPQPGGGCRPPLVVANKALSLSLPPSLPFSLSPSLRLSLSPTLPLSLPLHSFSSSLPYWARAPRVVLPDRALCLPTFCYSLLTVNKCPPPPHPPLWCIRIYLYLYLYLYMYIHHTIYIYIRMHQCQPRRRNFKGKRKKTRPNMQTRVCMQSQAYTPASCGALREKPLRAPRSNGRSCI